MKRRRLKSARIVLRPPEEGDREALAGWYHLPDGGPDQRLLVITRIEDHSPLGVVEYRVEPSRLVFERVVEAPEARGLGYGAEAVRAVEEDASERGRQHRFEAEIRPDEGLTLYFWLRLGYRPAVWPSQRRQRIISAVRMSR